MADTEHLICLCSDNERSQIAYVTFKDMQGAETAILLSVISLLNNFTIVLEIFSSCPFTHRLG